jgi:hypothetical protein
MSLLDRFRKGPATPSVTRQKIQDRPGPMTALESWVIVKPIAMQLDAGARLTLITSGLDITPQGRSFSWEYLFLLPGMGARALFTLSPPEDADDIDSAPIFLTLRINPASASDLKSSAALPEPFRDSPDVVAELSAAGVDFVAGPTDMKLESRLLPSGDAVWVTYYWDEERMARFAVILR